MAELWKTTKIMKHSVLTKMACFCYFSGISTLRKPDIRIFNENDMEIFLFRLLYKFAWAVCKQRSNAAVKAVSLPKELPKVT